MTRVAGFGISLIVSFLLASVAVSSAADLLPATMNLAAPEDQQSTGAPGDIQTAPGQWDILAGHPNDDVAADPAKFEGWAKVAVPGNNWPTGNPSCCWMVKRFKAPAEVKGLDCEILFERVQWSATVWLNGQKLGSWPDGYSAFRLLATSAIKPDEENVLVVRVGGFAEVPKSKSGKPLFPAGFSMAGQGGGGGIMGRVFVRFFNKVRITRLQVLPDIANSTANVMVRLEGAAAEAAVDLQASENGSGPDVGIGRVVGNAAATVKLTNGVGEATVPVAIKDVKLWETGKPFLYRLVASIGVAGKAADRTMTRFGMREVVCKPDGFYLNGHKVALFGWNGFGDQLFWRANPALFSREKFKEAVIAGAKAMNAVCVRTHTGPFPTWVLDMCDEEGLLVLSEFAVTVNCGKIDLDATEFATWQTDMEMEASSVVPYLANHPSIVMWVMTNESNNWHEYERGRLYQHFKKLDPSRPVIRASYDTPDARDIHSYAAMWKGSDGDFAFRCKMEAAKAARDKVPVMCSEYLGGVGGQVTRKWFGPDADNADPAVRKRLAADVSQFWAFRCMEQTEAVRRMGYSCILPFGYFGGVGPNTPKDPPPAPALYAIPSALAPVGVSVDLDNKHFLAGQEYKTDTGISGSRMSCSRCCRRCRSGGDVDRQPQFSRPVQRKD